MAIPNKEPDTKLNGQAHMSPHFPEKSETMGSTMDRASREIGKEFGSAMEQASAKANGYIKTSREYVGENPMRSVAVAAVTGLAIGSLMTLAFRSKK